MEVNSWDLFDTLIGRKCGKPHEIWKAMAYTLEDDLFVNNRIVAEREWQQHQKPYTLDHIYGLMARAYVNISPSEFVKMEWELEKKNVFPIKRYIEQVDPVNDIIVSDMYLSEEQLRELLAIAGLDFKGRIYVSPYGKLSGNAWKQIKEDGIDIKVHTGDNNGTDYRSPRRAGIQARHAYTSMSKVESKYHILDNRLGEWIRYHRLKHIVNEERERLYTWQITYNVPLLWAISQELNRLDTDKYLFMSRDTQLLKRMFDKLYPDKNTEYLFISRACLRNGTENYKAYLNARLGENVTLCDIASSLGSLKAALPWIKVQPKIFTAIYLAHFGVDISGIDLQFMFTNSMVQINNTYLEMMNYADHWHVADVDKDEKPVFDQEDEYDMKLVKGYHDIVDDMISDIPVINASSTDVALEALAGIQENKMLIGNYFPRHVPLEMKVKPNLVFHTAKDPVTVIGAIQNYKWADIEPWWKSLKATGFSGEIQMLAYNIQLKDIRRMKQVGITVHQRDLTHPQVVVSRFLDLARLLRTINPDQWILFPDVGDIVFQYNPAHFLAGVKKELVLAHEGVLFSGNRWTDSNLRESFPDIYVQLKSTFFYNAGSMAGRARILSMLSERIYDMCMQRPDARSHDQAAMNYLVREEPFLSRTLFLGPNDQWCFCAASSIMAAPQDARNYSGGPVQIAGGRCYVRPGLVSCMFHHYDRNPRIKDDVIKSVNRRYAARLRH